MSRVLVPRRPLSPPKIKQEGDMTSSTSGSDSEETSDDCSQPSSKRQRHPAAGTQDVGPSVVQFGGAPPSASENVNTPAPQVRRWECILLNGVNKQYEMPWTVSLFDMGISKFWKPIPKSLLGSLVYMSTLCKC